MRQLLDIGTNMVETFVCQFVATIIYFNSLMCIGDNSETSMIETCTSMLVLYPPGSVYTKEVHTCFIVYMFI